MANAPGVERCSISTPLPAYFVEFRCAAGFSALRSKLGADRVKAHSVTAQIYTEYRTAAFPSLFEAARTTTTGLRKQYYWFLVGIRFFLLKNYKESGIGERDCALHMKRLIDVLSHRR